MGHLGVTLGTSPRAPLAPPLPASVVRRLRRGPSFGSSKRSDGALPPGGSALGAVAEVHDTVAEPVFLQQLQLGAGVAGECGLALTDEHRTNEEVAFIDHAGRTTRRGRRTRA